ncbi:MAG: formylglycine-generating enzyme family protein [Limisphaerales bacterium]
MNSCPQASRRSFLLQISTSLLTAPRLLNASPTPSLPTPRPPLIPATAHPADWPAFEEALRNWRAEQQTTPTYNPEAYAQPNTSWASRCLCCGFLMLYDEHLFNPHAQSYQLDALLESARKNFGGFDAIVLWHAYPRIGTDHRNQFDFYRDMPGGILGLRKLIRQCHDAETRVFINYNPWDTGTQREPRPDSEALALLLQALNADGIFLDTMPHGSNDFARQLQTAKPGAVLESELALPIEHIPTHHLSWAQWLPDSHTPGVLRNKWLEPRHQLHLINRWDTDHSGELHTAWMNGTGILVWENVFGSHLPWCPRDRSILRSMLPIQRRYHHLFTSPNRTPLVPTQNTSLFASLWQNPHQRIWTLVNRAHTPSQAPTLQLTPTPGSKLFDLIQGAPAKITRSNSGQITWNASIPPRGVACLLETTPDECSTPGFLTFLQKQSALARTYNPSTTPAPSPTRTTLPKSTQLHRTPPPNTIAIPGTTLELQTSLRIRECGFYQSNPPPNHQLASSYNPALQFFSRKVTLNPYAIDITPVTNAQFAEFLTKSGYHPGNSTNFLKHWGHGHPAASELDHPVTYVSLEDARAYASWAGKRLPTEAEWQHAAQGPQQLAYPWGPNWQPNHCNDGSTTQHTTPVSQFPQGQSPFGVLDLCGNTWEWTESESTDGHTRFCLLKGGSFYQAQGSNWYFEGGPQKNQHTAKFLLLYPGLDRCATIGFRCLTDLRPD